MDHSIGALSPLQVAQVTQGDFEAVTLKHPRLLQALYWETLVSTAIQREWALNLCQRSALERLAHLICEIFIRLRVAGLVTGARCEWPITQVTLADATGLTPVHVSRTIQELNRDGLIGIENHHLRITDFETLSDLAMFTVNYLHLDHEGARIDSNEP